MSTRTLGVSETLQAYLIAHNPEPPVLAELRAETARHERFEMQISPEQGAFLGWLVRLMGARRALEVGVFTGYSSLAVALALPPDGHLLACDINEEWTSVAKRYWGKAGVDAKISLQLRPALETLDEKLKTGEAGTYDFAFIDADKENYLGYYERCLQLLRVGGVLAVDNTLWSGSVADPSDARETTRCIRALNLAVSRDRRVEATLLPIGDGLLLARKI
jgi:predicted O-methyltransferase YrrM